MMKIGLFATLLLSTNLLANNLYSLEDLKALENEKNYEEFLLHVNDIRPSQRLEEWQTMYRNMLVELIDNKIKSKDYTLKSFEQIQQHSSRPFFSGNETIRLKQSLYSVSFFRNCYTKSSTLNTESCDAKLTNYWNFSTQDPDSALEFATIIKNSASKLNSWDFTKKAIAKSSDSYYCNRSEVQQEILNFLNKKTFEVSFDNNYKKLVNENLNSQCFKNIIPFLKNKLSLVSTTTIEKELAFNLLSNHSALSETEEDLYAVLFLSDGPVVGDRLNIAWKRIESLSQNFERRNKILGEIKKLPLIGDYTFKNPKTQRNQAIINLLALNFPEYLNHYANECLKYITFKADDGGQVKNRQCQNFLDLAQETRQKKNIQWVSDLINTQYSSIKK